MVCKALPEISKIEVLLLNVYVYVFELSGSVVENIPIVVPIVTVSSMVLSDRVKSVGGSFITTSNLSGFYNYMYIATSTFCPDDSANIVIDVSPACDYLGLEENTVDYIQIFPNPTTSSIFISNPVSENQFEITLYDLKGKVLYSQSEVLIDSSTTEIDVQKLEDGIYIIRLSNQSIDKTYRIVKQ